MNVRSSILGLLGVGLLGCRIVGLLGVGYVVLGVGCFGVESCVLSC